MANIYGDGTTTASNGANVRIDALREKAVRMAKREIIFEQLCSKETMPMNYGKTLKVHKTLYILDDRNVNDQGLDQSGNAQTGSSEVLPADPGAVVGAGNLYGSSRSVVDVSAGMPLLAEGAGRVNRVGMTRITMQGTLTRMGAFLEYTDEVELFSDQKMEVQYYEKMGELAAELYDDYLQTELLGAGGMECYGGAATSLLELQGNEAASVPSVLSYDLIRKVQVSLKANLAKKHTSIITGSTKVGTVPVNASWFAYCGSASTIELEKLKDDFDERAYTPARMYAAAGNLAKGEVGAVHSTRFIEAERMMHYDGAGLEATVNTDGYSTTVLTADQATDRGQAAAGEYYDGFPIIWVTKAAFATIGLQGNKKIKFLAKKPGKATQDDPHGLMGLYSFNFFAGSINLEPEKIARVVHVATGTGVCPVAV